jgi:soluble lytic murein transglycosylase-like protein
VGKTRILFLVSAFLIQSAITSPIHAGYREDAFKKLIDYMRSASDASEYARIGELHKTYLNTSLNQDRKIVSLSLGAHYLDSNPKLAIQYLTSAKLACDDQDPLFPMILYYLGLAKLRGGNPEQALKLSGQLSSMEVPLPLKKLSLVLGVDAAYALENFDVLHDIFDSLSTRFTLGRRLEEIAKKGAETLEKKGDFEKSDELMEDIARNFPNTEGSRWAFQKLQNISCDRGRPKKYAPSLKFLTQLARNITPENGVENFIATIIDRPVKMDSGEIRRLQPSERVDFLVDAKLFKKALEELEILYKDQKNDPKSETAPVHLMNLGRLELKLDAPYLASSFFSKFLLAYPNHYLVPRVTEYLGDALRYTGYPKAAAQTYAYALAKKDSRILRWFHFWMVYRSGDFSQALTLIERKNYLEVREGDDPIILEYWRGRILEKLGQNSTAEGSFRSILTRAGSSFYAAMIAAKYPHLIEQRQPSQDISGIASKPSRLAAKLLPGTMSQEEISEIKAGEVRYISELIQNGLRDLASIHLHNLNWNKINDDDSLAALSRLAYIVGDYNPAKRNRSKSLESMQSIPRDYVQLLEHQRKHKDAWKIFYPEAYEKIISPISKGIKISPYLVLAIMRAESFYNKDANSPVGAYGLMQLMPYTALKIANLLHDEEFDMLELGRPEVNISYGAYYLDRLIRYYSGNPYVAVAAYNAGPKAVSQWVTSCAQCEPDEFIESIPFRETRRYVREVMRNFVQYNRIYLERPEPLPLPPMPSRLPEEEIF